MVKHAQTIRRQFVGLVLKGLGKRKLGVYLTDQLKVSSKDLMGTHDVIEFLGNLLKHYDKNILDIVDYFQI